MLSFSRSFSYRIGIISLLSIIISIFLISFVGIEKGLEFQGGVVVEFIAKEKPFDQPSEENIANLRNLLNKNFSTSFNLQIVDNNKWSLSFASSKLQSDKQSEEILIKLNHILNNSIFVVKSEYIGPQVTKILYKQSVTGLLLALFAMFVYVAIRFNLYFGLVATICLLHDIVFSVLFVSIFKIELNLTIVAALLTIIGYSINNTIIVYDRIRNFIKTKIPGDNLISSSVKQVIKRTIITSSLTIFSLLGLIFFSDVSIKHFAITVICGIFVGGYSSIILAPSLLVFFRSPLVFVDHDSKYATVRNSSYYTS